MADHPRKFAFTQFDVFTSKPLEGNPLAVVHDATAMTRFFTRLLLSDWPREDVEDLQRLMNRLADTVAEKFDTLPEVAMAELGRTQPALADAAASIAEQARSRGVG